MHESRGLGDVYKRQVHEFANPGTERVMWLETQAPGPPSRHSYRFARDWSYLEDRLS